MEAGAAEAREEREEARAGRGRGARTRKLAAAAAGLASMAGVKQVRKAVGKAAKLAPLRSVVKATARGSATALSKIAQVALLGPMGPFAVATVKQSCLALARAARKGSPLRFLDSLLRDAHSFVAARRLLLLYAALTFVEYQRRDRKRARVAAATLLFKDITYDQASMVMQQSATPAHLYAAPQLCFSGQRETPNFVNQILKTLWPYVESATQLIISDLVEPILDDLDLPPGVAHIGFDKFRLGDKAPIIEYISTSAKEKDVVVLDVALLWAGNPDISLAVRGPAIYGGLYPLSVRVRNLALSGELRVTIRIPRDDESHLGGVAITLIRQPSVRYGVELRTIPGQPFSMAAIPGLEGFLQRILAQVLEKSLVFPEAIVEAIPIPIDETDMTMSEDEQRARNELIQEGVKASIAPRPCGTLRVLVREARRLQQADLIGNSDPYCILGIATSSAHPKAHRRFRGNTKHINNTLDPVWEESFEFSVYDRNLQSLLLTVYDYDIGQVGNGDMLGEVEIGLNQLPDDDSQERWYRLAGGRRNKPEKMWKKHGTNPIELDEGGGAARDQKLRHSSMKRNRTNVNSTSASASYALDHGEILLRLQWVPEGNLDGLSSSEDEPKHEDVKTKGVVVSSPGTPGKKAARQSGVMNIQLARVESAITKLEGSTSKLMYTSQGPSHDEQSETFKAHVSRLLRGSMETASDGELETARRQKIIDYLCSCGIPNRALPHYAVNPEMDSANWLNSLVAFIWIAVGELAGSKAALINKSGILKGPDDSFLWMLGASLDGFSLGTLPPLVTGIRAEVYKPSEVNLEIGASVMSDMHVSISASPLGRRMCGIGVTVDEVQFSGLARIGLKPLVNELPLISAVSVQLMRKPAVLDARVAIRPCMWMRTPLRRLAIRPLDLPGAGWVLRHVLMHLMRKNLEFPKMLGVDILDMNDKSVEKYIDNTREVRGVVRLRVLEVRNMPVEMLKVSDDGTMHVRFVSTYTRRMKGGLADNQMIGRKSYMARSTHSLLVLPVASASTAQKGMFNATFKSDNAPAEAFCAGIEAFFACVGVYADRKTHSHAMTWLRRIRAKKVDKIMLTYGRTALDPKSKVSKALSRMQDYIERNLPDYRREKRNSELDAFMSTSSFADSSLSARSFCSGEEQSKKKMQVKILPFSKTVLAMMDSMVTIWNRLNAPDTNRRRWPGQPRTQEKKGSAWSECAVEAAVRKARSDNLNRGTDEVRRNTAATLIQTAWRGYTTRRDVRQKMKTRMKESRVKKRKISKATVHLRDNVSAPEEQILNEVGVYNSDLIGLAMVKGNDPKILQRVKWTPEGEAAEVWIPLRGAGPTTQVRLRLEYKKFKGSYGDNAEQTTLNGDPLPKEGEVVDVHSEATLAQLMSTRIPSAPVRKMGTLLVDVLSASDLMNKRAGVFFARLRPYVQLRVGAHVRRTAPSKGLNPKWHLGNREVFSELCPMDADVSFLEASVWASYEPHWVTKVLDKHLFLGMNRVALDEVVRARNQELDLRLEGVQQGSLKLKLSWMELEAGSGA